jgi:hypothetical protein
MPASSVYLQDVVDDAMRFGDLVPVIHSGGSSLEPALTIANRTMQELCSQRYNWKWNSFNVPTFQTISWQNDYAVPGVTLLGWLENAVCIDINSTQVPKRKWKMEVVKDLQPSSDGFGRPFQVCWLNNQTLLYGTWGTGLTLPNVNNTGLTNPGPGVVYTNPLGDATTPQNPTTQIIDTNGNIQVINWGAFAGTTGTCGNVQPTWPAANAAVGTNTTDGTVVWTVVDPLGQGFRLQMIPAAAGVVWQIMIRAQYKPVRFTSLGQTLTPIPDDFAEYFKQGFRAYCYQRSPEEKIRAKFQPEFALWQKEIVDAEGQADREPESYGAYPNSDIMQPGWSWPGPAWPFGFY